MERFLMHVIYKILNMITDHDYIMDENLEKQKEKIRKEREKEPNFFSKIKKKLKKLKKDDPNVYPMD